MNVMNKPVEPAVGSKYVLDAPYTWSFFEYQSPVLMSYVARLNGFAAPELDTAFTYCDLGCGNGVTVNLLAGAYPEARFHGVDFNAEHIENARECAASGNLENAVFADASFEQYLQDDPPQFDFIAMHGVYSWVDAEIRAQICALVDKTLKPGGLLYVSYNALPGWSELIPLWDLMQSYTSHVDGNSLSRAAAGLAALSELRDAGAGYFRTNPSASRYLDSMLKRNPNYVAHEFCNGCFEPLYFREVAEGFQTLGMTFAGTAKTHRNNPANVISSRHVAHLEAAVDEIDRESRISFIRNEMFRRDIYIRGGRKEPGQERGTLANGFYLSSKTAGKAPSGEFRLGRRKINLVNGIHRDVASVAADGSHSIAELCDHPELVSHEPGHVTAAAHDLIASGHFKPLLAPAQTVQVEQGNHYELASAINRAFLDKRLLEEGKTYLQSPITGSAIKLKLGYGLLARALDGRTLDQARSAVAEQLQSLTPEHRARLNLPEPDKLPEWLEKHARRFGRHYLPILLKFGVLKTKQ